MSSAYTPAERAALALHTSDPAAALAELCDLVGGGGTLTQAAQAWGVPVYALTRWLYATPERSEAYQAATEAQSEAWREQVRAEVLRFCAAKVEGELTGAELAQLRELPAAQRPLILKAQVKLRALELMGREVELFSERVDVTHTHTLAEQLKAARARVIEHRAAPAKLDASDSGEGGGGRDLAAGPPTPRLPAQKIIDAGFGDPGPGLSEKAGAVEVFEAPTAALEPLGPDGEVL